jgi:hypothetical protein
MVRITKSSVGTYVLGRHFPVALTHREISLVCCRLFIYKRPFSLLQSAVWEQNKGSSSGNFPRPVVTSTVVSIRWIMNYFYLQILLSIFVWSPFPSPCTTLMLDIVQAMVAPRLCWTLSKLWLHHTYAGYCPSYCCTTLMLDIVQAMVTPRLCWTYPNYGYTTLMLDMAQAMVAPRFCWTFSKLWLHHAYAGYCPSYCCTTLMLDMFKLWIHHTYAGHCPRYCSTHVFSRLIAIILSRFGGVTIDGVWIRLFVHQWLYSLLLGPGLLLNVVIFFTEKVGLLGRVISPSQGRYLHTRQHKQNKRTHRHPCLERDSNARSKRSSELKQFMP